jgi:hypothetical protein
MDEKRATSIREETTEEEALVAKMDSALRQDRAPYCKSQLRYALNMLADVEMLIDWEQKAQPQNAGIFLATAEANIAIVRSIRQQIQKLVDPVGDPSLLVEYPR